MASSTMFAAAMMVAILFVSTTITTTKAQNNIPSCAQKLIPCAEYIANATVTPPASCCDPIKQAVKDERPCLCNLYNTPGLLQAVGVNVTQALDLTKRCGVTADLSACKTGNTTAEGPTATAGGTTPPGVPGNDGSRMAMTGFSSLLLFWAAAYSLIH